MNTFNQETDMGYITQVVQAVANALVMSTEFPGQINAMKADLASLHNDLETTKGRNAELDALLHDTRRQRDEAEQALSQAKNELALVTTKVSSHEETIHNYHELENRLRSELEQAKKDRDQYGLDAMSAEDRAKAAEAKLDKLREAMGMPREVPKAEPVALSQSAPQASPTPSVEPAQPAPPKTRIYENEPGYQKYAENERWDTDKNLYYNDLII